MRKSALYAFGLVVAILVALGLIVLSSASEAYAALHYKDAHYFVKRQFAFLGVGIVAATLVAVVDYHIWRKHEWLTWGMLALVMLLLLAVFGFKPIKGSHRWLPLGPVSLQPSEFAKLATVLLVSVWMDKAGWRVELFLRGALYPALLIGVIALPVVLEPDFGSTMVICGVGLLVMFVAGTRLLHMVPLALAGVAAVAVKVCANANRMARMAAWLGFKLSVGVEVLDEAAKNAEHQGVMALAAVGNGGVWGVGLNNSMQKQAYLPEAHTDMIFAIGAEELGLFFSVAVLLLLLAFFALSVYIARRSSDRFGRLLVVGMSFILFFQSVFNLGVVCGAFPMKGMALPFFSYGGTNMLTSFLAVGTILSVGIHSWRDRKRLIKQNVFV